MLSWTPNASIYDVGRPFPAQQVQALFADYGATRREQPLKVFEPGCGTGRILVPLATAYPHWHFIGADSASAPLAVCHLRCKEAGISHVSLSHTNIVSLQTQERFDLLIHSSVLHVVQSWRETLTHLSSLTTPSGHIALVGDYGDLYDAILNRPFSAGTAPALLTFAREYHEARRSVGASSPESSQVGCRWDLESTNLAQKLLQEGWREMHTKRITWQQDFSPADLMQLIAERAYSSLFTLTDAQLGGILSQLKEKKILNNLPPRIPSRHHAMLRLFQRE